MRRTAANVIAWGLAATALAAQGRPERCQLKFVGPDPSERVSIENVEFRGNSELSQAEQDEIVRRVKSMSYGDTESLKSQVDLEIRNELERRGYFEMNDTIVASPVGAEPQDKYRVVAEIRAGEEYRAGAIQMVNVRGKETPLAIAPSTLRELVSLHEGDLFDTSAVREGIQKMSRAYGEQGYIDATIELEFEVNQTNRTIELRLNIDEQVQYRIRTVNALGVDNVMKNEIQSALRSGDVFNSQSLTAFLNEFLRKHGDALPPKVSYRDVRMDRDVKERTVSIQIDFRSCEQIPK